MKKAMPLDRYRVVVSPEAEMDLEEIREYIAWKSSRRKANNYIRRISNFYKSLSTAPHRGELSALRPGMRSIGFETRVSILFAVSREELVVEILGVYYGGRSIEEVEEVTEQDQ